MSLQLAALEKENEKLKSSLVMGSARGESLSLAPSPTPPRSAFGSTTRAKDTTVLSNKLLQVRNGCGSLRTRVSSIDAGA